MTGALTFNTNSLQTYDPVTRLGIITNKIQHTDLPEKEIALIALANNNGSVIPYSQYTRKKVTISGAIRGSSAADLDDRIDQFKAYFNGRDKNLDTVYAGATRRYTATANAIAVEVISVKGFIATFNVEFVCSLPFGRSTSTT